MASASLVGAQTLQTLCSFNNTNGAGPTAALTLGNDGNFYGTTYSGGSYSDGTVFQVTTNGTLTTLVSFNGTNGAAPLAGLTLGDDGNFYGTTCEGGSHDSGTVFMVTTNGILTTLVSFKDTDEAYPEAALTLGNDGNFYGTTRGTLYGTNYGTVFMVTTKGTLTTLVSFNGTNGEAPEAGLTLGNDGDFYGTTSQGGSCGYGTVFKVTTNGTLTTLVSFANTNGANPYAGLTLGTDGNFYSTTPNGGSFGYFACGTVFKVTTNGALITLVSFYNAEPLGGLTLGNDGNFYGTTHYGGSNGLGTIFKVTTNGALTALVSFTGANGEWPDAALTLGCDGNFYGTTYGGGSGGSVGYGTVFCLLAPPPVIIVQPESRTNKAGATVTFLVSATSLMSMGYQWQKNGINLVDGGNISGSTTDALTITGISDSDAGTYSVIVSNANGSVTNYATLTVIVPPTLALQFSSGYPQLNLTGTLSNNFVVQYCTNLANPNWINLLSVTNLSASPYLFVDPAGAKQPARFYRAFMQ